MDLSQSQVSAYWKEGLQDFTKWGLLSWFDAIIEMGQMSWIFWNCEMLTFCGSHLGAFYGTAANPSVEFKFAAFGRQYMCYWAYPLLIPSMNFDYEQGRGAESTWSNTAWTVSNVRGSAKLLDKSFLLLWTSTWLEAKSKSCHMATYENRSTPKAVTNSVL